jgi:hypothetical protein
MDQAILAAKARRYWEIWLPRKTKKLKDAGEFDTDIQIAAVRAHAEIVELIMRGYQESEAIELALQKYIFLEPEQPND